MTKNTFENIDISKVKGFSMTGICAGCSKPVCNCTKFMDTKTARHLDVEMESSEHTTHDLINAFQIFYCNEFLRSLNLMPADMIGFKTFPEYARLIASINDLLHVKQTMEETTGKQYSELGIYASQISAYIHDRLLPKHHLSSRDWNEAMNVKPLKEWVSEALTYFA